MVNTSSLTVYQEDSRQHVVLQMLFNCNFVVASNCDSTCSTRRSEESQVAHVLYRMTSETLFILGASEAFSQKP